MPDPSTKQWFTNLGNLQKCSTDINTGTPENLKTFSKAIVQNFIPNNRKNELRVCWQHKGMGAIPDGVLADLNKTFSTFLDEAGIIVLRLSIRETDITPIARRNNPDSRQASVSKILAMKIDDVFGAGPLSSNSGKRELDNHLKSVVPDLFYPTDGSFLADGSQTLTELVRKIIS